ncbi:MAG: DUF4157 domain-containing protein, partial [Kofleriaceae bacterium]
HAAADPRPAPAEVGRNTAEAGVAAMAGAPAGVPIAPDRRDHTTAPRLRAAADIELRTLVAHVERNLARTELAASEPEREAARSELQTRCDVAVHNVAAADHAVFREELERVLGGAQWAALVETLADAPAIESIVQRAAAGGSSTANIQRAAQRGVATGGGQLPHLAQIQRAFGRHDVSAVSAHVGGAAAEASLAIGARAYAVGNKVAFATAPDLRLAAHEAAHVVQQRRGVQVSGGVGRAGDSYEQHADAVADLVVRGESAEALLERHGTEGGGGGEAIQLDPLEVLGHYTGANITMQLAQAGETVVGRIQIHRAVSVGVQQYDDELSVERTASEPTGDRFTGRAGRGPVTMTIAPDGTARVRVRGQMHLLHRDSAASALSGPTLRAASDLDRAIESAPLTGEQQTRLDHLVQVAVARLPEFFARGVATPATHEQRLESLALIDGAVRVLFGTQTTQQARSLVVLIRTRLQAQRLVINGRTWGALDWLYMAMAQMTEDPMLAHLHGQLEIPFGADASVLDGGGTPATHCYRIRIIEVPASISAGPVSVGGAIGMLEVAEFAVPRGFDASGADPHVEPVGTPLWTQQYRLTRERVEVGFSESAGHVAHHSHTTIYTPWPWDRGDFVGPISGINVAASAGVTVGDRTVDPLAPLHAGVLLLFGTCAFPPLPLELDETSVGLQGGFGITGTYEQGQIAGEQTSEMHPHVPIDETVAQQVGELREVHLAFATDEADLSAEARRQLREVLAWNQRLLRGGAAIEITGYASRLGSETHNLQLAGARTTHTAHAIIAAMPEVAERIAGETRGEGAAEAAGVVDGDNDQMWRRVDVSIAGTVVLRMFAEVPMTVADRGTITAE